MATFPALNPNVRVYTPGAHPSTAIPTMNGNEMGVRHNNAILKYILGLTFNGLTTAQHHQLVSHYNLHARFYPFDIPSSILTGSGLTFPSTYVWIYTSPPTTEHKPGLVTTSVELELIPPYTI